MHEVTHADSIDDYDDIYNGENDDYYYGDDDDNDNDG